MNGSEETTVAEGAGEVKTEPFDIKTVAPAERIWPQIAAYHDGISKPGAPTVTGCADDQALAKILEARDEQPDFKEQAEALAISGRLKQEEIENLKADLDELRQELKAMKMQREELGIPAPILRHNKVPEYLVGYRMAERGEDSPLSSYPDANESRLMGYADGLKKKLSAFEHGRQMPPRERLKSGWTVGSMVSEANGNRMGRVKAEKNGVLMVAVDGPGTGFALFTDDELLPF